MTAAATAAEFTSQRAKVRSQVRSPDASPAPAKFKSDRPAQSSLLTAAAIRNHDKQRESEPSQSSGANTPALQDGGGKRKKAEDGAGDNDTKDKKTRYDALNSLQVAAKASESLDVSQPLGQVEFLKALKGFKASARIEQITIQNGVYSTHHCNQASQT